jgi:hypothetical protein
MWIKDTTLNVESPDEDNNFNVWLNARVGNPDGEQTIDKILIKAVFLDSDDRIIHSDRVDVDVYIDPGESQDLSVKCFIWSTSGLRSGALSRISYYIEAYTAVASAAALSLGGKNVDVASLRYRDGSLDIKNVTLTAREEVDGDVKVGIAVVAQNQTGADALLAYKIEVKDRRLNVAHELSGEQHVSDGCTEIAESGGYINANVLKKASFELIANAFFRIHSATVEMSVEG